MILSIRTDKPEAEVGLYDGTAQVAHKTWYAHRQLAETIHTTIRELLADQNLVLNDITGVVVYEGPGSFTGLRIGISVANALADGLNIPVAAAGDDADWAMRAIPLLEGQKIHTPVAPKYGAPVHITAPKK